MLVLTRKKGEEIIIGENEIIIHVIKMMVPKDGFFVVEPRAQLHIGITAPNNISIHRKEIYERILKGEILQ